MKSQHVHYASPLRGSTNTRFSSRKTDVYFFFVSLYTLMAEGRDPTTSIDGKYNTSSTAVIQTRPHENNQNGQVHYNTEQVETTPTTTEGQQLYELTVDEQFRRITEDEYQQQYEQTIEAQIHRAKQDKKDKQAAEDTIERQLWTEVEQKRAQIQREAYYAEQRKNFILNNSYPSIEEAEKDFGHFRNQHEFLWIALTNTRKTIQREPDNSIARNAELVIEDKLQNLTNYIEEKTRKRAAVAQSPTPSVAPTEKKTEKNETPEAPKPKLELRPVHLEIESSSEENILIDLTEEQKDILAKTPVFIKPKNKAEKKTARISVQQTATQLHKQKLIQRSKKDQEKLKQQQNNIKLLQEREAFLTEQLSKVQQETLKRREAYDQGEEEDIEKLQKSLHHAERQTLSTKNELHELQHQIDEERRKANKYLKAREEQDRESERKLQDALKKTSKATEYTKDLLNKIAIQEERQQEERNRQQQEREVKRKQEQLIAHKISQAKAENQRILQEKQLIQNQAEEALRKEKAGITRLRRQKDESEKALIDQIRQEQIIKQEIANTLDEIKSDQVRQEQIIKQETANTIEQLRAEAEQVIAAKQREIYKLKQDADQNDS